MTQSPGPFAFPGTATRESANGGEITVEVRHGVFLDRDPTSDVLARCFGTAG